MERKIRKVIKNSNRLKRSIALIMLASLISFNATSSISYATLDPPKGTASGTTFTVKDTITDWGQLESLLSKYTLIKVATNAYVYTNDLSKYIHLGDESGTTFIAKIECATPKVMYPVKILPEYVVETASFIPAHDVNAISNPTILTNYKWQEKDLVYVYDKNRNNTVAIEHGVEDEKGKKMLQYCKDTSKFDSIDIENNRIIFEDINTPTEGISSSIYYQSVVNGHTSKGGIPRSAYSFSLTYSYTLYPSFYSTAKIDFANIFLGDIEISAQTSDGLAIEGAEFEIYEDSSCQIKAKRYNGSKWTNIGTVSTASDGKALVENLKAGSYYVKQVSTIDGYTIEEDCEEVVVANKNASLKLAPESGEGDELLISKENTLLVPEWEGNVRSNILDFDYDENNYELVKAEDYNGGGQVFIKSAGGNISILQDEDYLLLQESDPLNNPKYEIKLDGEYLAEYSTIEEAIQAINSTYIDGSELDSSSCQGHLSIEAKEDRLFNNSDNQSKVGFNNDEEGDEYVERPVTAYDPGESTLPIVVVAIIGIIMLVIV